MSKRKRFQPRPAFRYVVLDRTPDVPNPQGKVWLQAFRHDGWGFVPMTEAEARAAGLIP